MSASNSPTDIANLALDIIKTDNVSDIEMPGTDVIASVCNRWYDDIRRTLLEEHPWNFAISRRSIPLAASDPTYEYDDAYELPSDFLSLVSIKEDKYPLSYWEYRLENNRLVMDNSGAESIFITYVYDNTVVSQYSSAFKLYLAHALAASVVSKLTGNAGTIKRIQALVPVARANAKAHNGKNSPPRAYRVSRMLQGRQLYAG